MCRGIIRRELLKLATWIYTRRVIIRSAGSDIGNVAPAVIRHFIVLKWPHSVISRRNQAGRYIHIEGGDVRVYMCACVRACVPAACGSVRVEIETRKL